MADILIDAVVGRSNYLVDGNGDYIIEPFDDWFDILRNDPSKSVDYLAMVGDTECSISTTDLQELGTIDLLYYDEEIGEMVLATSIVKQIIDPEAPEPQYAYYSSDQEEGTSIQILLNTPSPEPVKPNYMNTKTPLERIADGLEATTSDSSNSVRTLILEDVINKVDWSMKLTKSKNEYIEFFSPYVVLSDVGESYEEYTLKDNVSMNLKVEGTGTYNYDGTNVFASLRKMNSENFNEVDFGEFESPYHFLGQNINDYVSFIDESGESEVYLNDGDTLTITLTVEEQVTPTPGYMNGKSSLERIAIALETQIGEPSEDKGYLSEKHYLERIAVAVEGGAGQGNSGGSIVYPTTPTIMRIGDNEVVSAEPISETSVKVTFKNGETGGVTVEQDPETGAYRITSDNVMFCFNNGYVSEDNSHNGAELFGEVIKAWYKYLN